MMTRSFPPSSAYYRQSITQSMFFSSTSTSNSAETNQNYTTFTVRLLYGEGEVEIEIVLVVFVPYSTKVIHVLCMVIGIPLLLVGCIRGIVFSLVIGVNVCMCMCVAVVVAIIIFLCSGSLLQLSVHLMF